MLFFKRGIKAAEKLPVEAKKEVYIDTLTYKQFNELILSLSDDISKIIDDPTIQKIIAASQIEGKAKIDALDNLDRITGSKRFDYFIKHIFKTKEKNARNILAALTGNNVDGYENKLMLDVWKDINAIKNSQMKEELFNVFFKRQE